MTKRLLSLLMFVALAVASAKMYKVTLFQPTVLSGTELQPGSYQLNVDNNKVVFTNSKQSVESAVKVEQADKKFPATVVRYASGEGKNQIQEIRLGGTNVRLVFSN